MTPWIKTILLPGIYNSLSSEYGLRVIVGHSIAGNTHFNSLIKFNHKIITNIRTHAERVYQQLFSQYGTEPCFSTQSISLKQTDTQHYINALKSKELHRLNQLSLLQPLIVF